MAPVQEYYGQEPFHFKNINYDLQSVGINNETPLKAMIKNTYILSQYSHSLIGLV